MGNRKYTTEFKLDAVRLALPSERLHVCFYFSNIIINVFRCHGSMTFIAYVD